MAVRLGADAMSSDVGELQALGATFISRYVSDFPSKNITFNEAAALSAAGIDIVTNWENNTNDWQGGYSAGHRNATEAWRQHKAAGGMDGRPIYFSVDEDVTVDDTMRAYFKGAGDALTGPGQVGVYASTLVCNTLKAEGLVKWTWRSMSTGWRGGVGNPGDFNVEQTGGFNSKYDRDASITDDFGQWRHGFTPAPGGNPPGPTPVPVPTPSPQPDPQPQPAPGGDLPTPRDVWAYKGNNSDPEGPDAPDVHQSLLTTRDNTMRLLTALADLKAEVDAIKMKLGA